MNIQILQLIEGAQAATGLAVVIDVFRAFSLEPYLFDRGAEKIIAVGSKERAYELKEQNPDYVLCGERKGVILPGFDCGNSPWQTSTMDLRGKTVVHTTSAGTQGLVNAYNADEILTGSLVNSRAIARYILREKPENVSLVCMGLRGLSEAAEDTLCGRYIKGILENEELDMEKELQALRKDETSKRFFDPKYADVFPEQDWHMSCDYDRFDFVLHARKLDDDCFEITREFI